jgi:hypothetical protein
MGLDDRDSDRSRLIRGILICTEIARHLGRAPKDRGGKAFQWVLAKASAELVEKTQAIVVDSQKRRMGVNSQG